MKNLYLVLFVIVLVIIIIPFFEGLASGASIQFLGDTWSFINIYPIFILFGMIEGVCITLYLQAIMSEIKSKSDTAFDL